MFTSESKLFTIRQPIVTTTRGQGISSSSSSSSSPSGSVRGSTSATAATTPVNVPVSNSSDTGTLSVALYGILLRFDLDTNM